MIPLSCVEINAMVNGTMTGPDVTITSVSTDSRVISAGELFIALKGPNFDGSAFVADVKTKGAAAVVSGGASPQAVSISNNSSSGIRLTAYSGRNRVKTLLR